MAQPAADFSWEFWCSFTRCGGLDGALVKLDLVLLLGGKSSRVHDQQIVNDVSDLIVTSWNSTTTLSVYPDSICGASRSISWSYMISYVHSCKLIRCTLLYIDHMISDVHWLFIILCFDWFVAPVDLLAANNSYHGSCSLVRSGWPGVATACEKETAHSAADVNMASFAFVVASAERAVRMGNSCGISAEGKLEPEVLVHLLVANVGQY